MSEELLFSSLSVSIKSSIIWVIVLSFCTEYKRNLSNLRWLILIFNVLFFMMPVHWLCIHVIIGGTRKQKNKEVIPMLLNYQYRIYPDTNQKLELNEWLRICRYWYNWQLGDRFNWWELNRNYTIFPQGELCLISCTIAPFKLRDNPNLYSQKKLLPEFKEDLIKVGHSGELLMLI